MVAQMHAKLDAASKAVTTCQRSLEKVKKDSPEKNNALFALKALNMRITYIGSVLPPSPEPTTPSVVVLIHRLAYLLRDPIEQLDIIAQMLTLLDVVCHVIIGLAHDPCNFIIDTVAIII
ncbi:hypothetical protein B0H17DRAFT_1190565 [Mycena rosella]|uniref:Uncharacterized protein n=1 Tax=Mycena rosella TaxID=1033263 RepID=A0AAD7MCX5_MYCRO|nr:hypothetical protein B0H17DRAFT_1190565 [Mycena rosella]